MKTVNDVFDEIRKAESPEVILDAMRYILDNYRHEGRLRGAWGTWKYAGFTSSSCVFSKGNRG